MTIMAAATRWWETIGSKNNEADVGPPDRKGRLLYRIVNILGAHTPLADITTGRIFDLRDARRRDMVRSGKCENGKPLYHPVAARTVNRTVALLRRVLLTARDDWQADVAPLPKWKKVFLKEPKKTPRVFDFTERRTLDQVERPELRAIRQFSLLTSLRLDECLIEWPQVDFERGFINLRQKGDDPRQIIITPPIRALLRGEHGKHPVAVFTFIARRTTRNGKSGDSYVRGQIYPASYWGLKSAERRDWEKAGFKIKGSVRYATFHDLRRTAARDQYEADGILAARDLLGHKDVKTTERYLGVGNERRMRESMSKRDAYVAEMQAKADAAAGDAVTPIAPSKKQRSK